MKYQLSDVFVAIDDIDFLSNLLKSDFQKCFRGFDYSFCLNSIITSIK